MGFEEFHDKELFRSFAPFRIAEKREEGSIIGIDLRMRISGWTEEGNGLYTEKRTEEGEIVQSLCPYHMLDTALFHGIFRSFGGDDTVYDAPVVSARDLFPLLGPCSDLSEIPREKFMKFLSVSDRDLLEENSFGREHILSNDYFPVRNLEIHRIYPCIRCSDDGPVFRYGDGTDLSFYELDLSDVFDRLHIFVILRIRFEDPNLIAQDQVEVVEIRSIEEVRSFLIVECIILGKIIDPDRTFGIIRKPENLVDCQIFLEDIESSVDTEGENGMVFRICRIKDFCLGSETVNPWFVFVDLFSIFC